MRLLKLKFAILALVWANLINFNVLADDNNEQLASEQYQSGISHFESEEYMEAIEAFRKAYAAKASWKLLYNIGQAAAAAKDYGLALQMFEQYLVDGQEELTSVRIEEVSEEIKRMKLVAGYLEMNTPVVGILKVDGLERGETPLKGVLPITAGDRSIELIVDGNVVFQTTVTFSGGVTQLVKTEDDNTSDSVPVASTDKKIKPGLVPGIVLGGVGLVGIGIGTAFTIKGAKDQDEAKGYTDQDKIDDYDNNILPLNNTMKIVGFAVGGAFLVAGAVLIGLHIKNKKKNNTQALRVLPALDGVVIQF